MTAAQGNASNVASNSPQLSQAAAVNWLWLVDTPGRDRALVVADASGPWAIALQRHFSAVVAIRATDMRARLATPREAARTAPSLFAVESASVDCVLLPGLLADWRTTAAAPSYTAAYGAVADECARVLRRGGVLYASGPNPWWYQHVRARALSRARALRRALRRAGLVSIRDYFAEPSDLAPAAIVPDDRTAIVGYERQERAHRGRAPRLLAAAGLHGCVYPTRLMLAFA